MSRKSPFTNFWRIYYTKEDKPLFEKMEAVRRARGMSRKGFIMHGIANTYPELTEEIVRYLIAGGVTNKDSKAVAEEIAKSD